MSGWLNIDVKGGAIWPTEETTVEFGGHQLLLKPATKDTEQSIHIQLIDITNLEALTLANRFLSVITWCDDYAMENMYGWSGNPIPVAVPRRTREIGSSIAFPFYRSIEENPKALLALALFREAKTINSIPYEFLGYFKILNIFWRDKYINKKNEIVEGLKSKIPMLTTSSSKSRLIEIETEHKDVAEYLYKSGRCAIAHANIKPIIDPDDIADLHRLSRDMPVIKEIAELLMENELNITREIYE